MKNLKNEFGPWALVTGASSGIGKGFAERLAKQGLNVLLVARREHLLQKLTNEIKTNYGVRAEYVVLDVTQPDFIKSLESKVADKEVRLLISNAGAATMGAFHKLEANDLEKMLHLNVIAQMKISHWFSKRLVSADTGGGILLVSSGVAYMGVPYMANYSAAKAYILNLGEALHHELKPHKVKVSVLVPGPTDAPGLTERTDADMEAHLPMKPQSVEDLVNEGLSALEKNKISQIGGGMNRVMTKAMNALMSREKAGAFWGKMMGKMVYVK